MLYYNYTDELYHYGVKGQKWGVRRYQNADGTLTDLGKKRYYSDEDNRAMLDEARSTNLHVGNVKEISEAGGFLKKQADVVMDNYSKYEKAVMTEYPTLHKNDKFIADVKNRLGKEMADLAKEDSDYRDLYEMEVEDHVFDCYKNYISSETTALRKNFYNSYNTYADNVFNMADQIVGEYGDEKLSRKGLLKSQDVRYKDAVFNTLRSLSDENGESYYKIKIAGYMEDDAYFEMVEDVRKRIMKELDD